MYSIFSHCRWKTAASDFSIKCNSLEKCITVQDLVVINFAELHAERQKRENERRFDIWMWRDKLQVLNRKNARMINVLSLRFEKIGEQRTRLSQGGPYNRVVSSVGFNIAVRKTPKFWVGWSGVPAIELKKQKISGVKDKDTRPEKIISKQRKNPRKQTIQNGTGQMKSKKRVKIYESETDEEWVDLLLNDWESNVYVMYEIAPEADIEVIEDFGKVMSSRDTQIRDWVLYKFKTIKKHSVLRCKSREYERRDWKSCSKVFKTNKVKSSRFLATCWRHLTDDCCGCSTHFTTS